MFALSASAQVPLILNGNVYEVVFGPDNNIYLSCSFVGTNSLIYQGNLRLNPDGSIDSSFEFDLSNPAVAFGFLSDGSILVNGVSFISLYAPNGAGIHDFSPIFASRALLVDDAGQRFYTGSGVYSTDGSLLVSFGANAMDALALAVYADGRILLGGTGGRLVRLNPDGSRDISFMPPTYLLGNGNVHGLAIQNHGDIIVAGANFAAAPNVLRLNGNGTLDAAFSATVAVYGPVCYLGDGTTLVSSGNNGTSISFDDCGRIISAGSIIRLGPDGSLFPEQPVPDPSFSASPGFVVYLPFERLNPIHSADTDADLSIGLFELTRVIELYNTRHGSVRTGAYGVGEGTEDGFAPDQTRTPDVALALARYHSADTRGDVTGSEPDGAIDLFELTRVIELYNYREGTVRTGRYRAAANTEDGFAAGA